MDRKTRLASVERGFQSGARAGRGSFWLPAANYYLLTIFLAGVLFALIWVGLNDEFGETPWIVAGLSVTVFAATLVLFREVVLRKIRRRAVEERRLAQHLQVSAGGRNINGGRSKLTLERNREILDDIRTKSEAAKVLGRLPDAHREVFDLCEQYLSLVSTDLATAGAGSPRIPALRKGQKFAASRHRFHMLKWAEVKAHAFTAQDGDRQFSERFRLAEEALEAVDSAIAIYPQESALIESRSLLNIFLLSARLKDAIGRAEEADADGNRGRALDHYRSALSELENSDVEFSEREAISARLKAEIGRLSRSAGV